MIKNKHISKITMLTALFIGGIVNAQEFYTCVPKRSWWMDTMGESIKRNVPSAYAIADAVKGAIPTPTPQKNWKLIKTINSMSTGTLLTLEPGKYKFILKNNKTAVQNVLDSPITADLILIGYNTGFCKSYIDELQNFLNGYDKRNLYYLQGYGFKSCGSTDDAGVSALVLGNIALFAYECKCDNPEKIFETSTLEIYKKNDD